MNERYGITVCFTKIIFLNNQRFCFLNTLISYFCLKNNVFNIRFVIIETYTLERIKKKIKVANKITMLELKVS